MSFFVHVDVHAVRILPWSDRRLVAACVSQGRGSRRKGFPAFFVRVRKEVVDRWTTTCAICARREKLMKVPEETKRRRGVFVPGKHQKEE